MISGASVFKIMEKNFFGYFDPEKIYYKMKMNNFRGDLTDISAKTEALVISDAESPFFIMQMFSRTKYSIICVDFILLNLFTALLHHETVTTAHCGPCSHV